MNNKAAAAILPFFLRILASLVLVGLVACKEDKEDQDHQPELTISGFQPSTGPFSTIVTIEGTGFDKNTSSNVVKFNDMPATVKSATAEELVVEVPKGAGTGKVTVQVNSRTATGGDFNYVYTVSVSTLAGSGYGGYANGQGSTAQFRSPAGVTTDTQGNIYVADKINSRIRMVSPDGVVTTFAGTGVEGHKDGHRSTAEFYLPTGIAMDAQGNIYVGESTRIRKITPDGIVSTLAGSGESAFADGQGSMARFRGTSAITTDPEGNLYVADANNQRIRKITPDGLVSTFAGSGEPGMDDGNSSTATFTFPTGLARDAQGNFFVADKGNHLIRKISINGTVSTLAGIRHSYPGYVDGEGSKAQFRSPFSLTVAPSGNIYVSDTENQRIRQITPDGIVSTLAGSKVPGWADGDGSTARFLYPIGITTDAQGNIYVADADNHRIRKITME